ncbi:MULTISPECIES: tRNA pseudouridine(55) synthase TruB [unclassified Psychrobacter]|uniref:tRNA pseudouridine(55) synthase TruB n=1 Tax=unclassified Psychrobacter TaxID=196806 RepID=UPI000C33422B|nr:MULTISPECIES: tRNA pseudouridine(55) synthase TruB [unclassified Psychrobacter]MBA6244970.1 tRNA pseudouridine(55) synthase TruB [Psychrobacter sp. Urea-trap-18]MBA6286515.1 tRNA pseudouridine(55) synthase TruB [Psychrobacter sp. Urea-trap-16]MBA6318526.1 tRNA pseudouridine(55) synthase TruB [Psychrobacter sp. Urea-trap-20]MBA6334747.1 tRNA pseudouridine(55) synthase TruB [Psychrobacter sp. Urea-trap-19]PKG61379.1 tRNA pseudouridine(55) synthase TruB [Psychrobacter sp. Choline-3u-12]
MSIASKQVDKKANKVSEKVKVSGVILVDKPKGMTSQQVVSKVKYLFKSPIHDSKKAGHTGTLDPMATGLLPICLGEATKFSHYQLDADKSYQATILLGSQTDTGDADGQIVTQASIPKFDEASLATIAQQFLGAQQQIPPMYSALKKDGKKLYEYARAGIEVDRPPRDITIKAINLQMIDDTQINLTVTCTKGTYVRVLAEDIAKQLGTLGHLTALRRTQVGNFSIDDAIALSLLEEHGLEERQSWLLPIDACIDIDAELTLTEEQCARVHMGQRLNVFDELTGKLKDYVTNMVSNQLSNDSSVGIDDDASTNGKADTDLDVPQLLEHEIPVDICLLNEQEEFLGLGSVSLNGRLQPKKLIQR